jgi:hypothetical protein
MHIFFPPVILLMVLKKVWSRAMGWCEEPGLPPMLDKLPRWLAIFLYDVWTEVKATVTRTWALFTTIIERLGLVCFWCCSCVYSGVLWVGGKLSAACLLMVAWYMPIEPTEQMLALEKVEQCLDIRIDVRLMQDNHVIIDISKLART